ncbi:MAG: T9SS type A sorting domain-containing protein, partial [bacterium]
KEEVYINYTTTESKEVEVTVYDITGSKITSTKRQVKAGANKLMLNGINKSGVYFIQIMDEVTTQTERINVIR